MISSHRRLSLSELIELCRVLRHYLGAGLTLPMVFRQQAKSGTAGVRPMAARIAEHLEQGNSLESALKREGDRLPALFRSLASVGERSGTLPEVFGELERYYLRQQQLRRQFLGRIAWPVIQFVASVFVIAALITILGQLTPATMPDGRPYDPLGLGLRGFSGATIFVACVVGPLLAAWGAWGLSVKVFGRRAATDRFLLGLPALGPCLRALALRRFCMALRMTTETGMSLHKAIRLSLRATDNKAFEDASTQVEKAIDKGEELTLSLAATRLFPDDFVHILAVAEESGTLGDVLEHQAEHYHEEAATRLAVLSTLASYVIGAGVGLFIIVAIFRLYGSYLNMLKLP